MYDPVLKRMQRAARAGQLYLTEHTDEELFMDDLTYDDVIQCLLTGQIIEQQFEADRGDYKYLVYGDSVNEAEMAVVAKFGYNNKTVIITVYRLRITDYD